MVSYPQAAGYTDVVFQVNWACNGTDGTYSDAIVGTTNVMLDPNAPYVPYNELTETKVIGWVQSVLGPEQVTTIQNSVGKQIANNYYTPTVLPNPWAAP